MCEHFLAKRANAHANVSDDPRALSLVIYSYKEDFLVYTNFVKVRTLFGKRAYAHRVRG